MSDIDYMEMQKCGLIGAPGFVCSKSLQGISLKGKQVASQPAKSGRYGRGQFNFKRTARTSSFHAAN
jgi:hypothetical protein